MKKVLSLAAAAGSMLVAPLAWASPLDKPIELRPPDNRAIDPNTPLATIFQNAMTLIFIVATLAAFIMLVWGAFQWITSGGEKEAAGNARKRITYALVGLAILALAFLILRVVGDLLGINIAIGKIPTLTK